MTQGKKSHTPENSTSECLFQCSENHWVKRIKKTTLENPVTPQPRSDLKKTFTRPRLTPCGPGTHSQNGWKGRGSPTDGMSCRERRSPPAAGSGACSSASAPGHVLWEMEDAVTVRPPSAPGKSSRGDSVWGQVGPMSLPLMHSKELNEQCGRDTPDPNG